MCGVVADGLDAMETVPENTRQCEKCKKRSERALTGQDLDSAQQMSPSFETTGSSDTDIPEEPDIPIPIMRMESSEVPVPVDDALSVMHMETSEVPVIPIPMSSKPQYVKCTEQVNYKAVVNALSRDAVRQTPLFDQLVSLAQRTCDVQPTSGAGKLDFDLWEGPAPPGYRGHLHSGKLQRDEPAAKRARKESVLFDGMGTAFMHEVVRLIARSGLPRSTIGVKNGHFSLLKMVVGKVLEMTVPPSLSKLAEDFNACVRMVASDLGLDAQTAALFFVDVAKGACPTSWLEKKLSKIPSACQTLKFAEDLRQELVAVRTAAFKTHPRKVQQWLVDHSNMPMAHALNYLHRLAEVPCCRRVFPFR